MDGMEASAGANTDASKSAKSPTTKPTKACDSCRIRKTKAISLHPMACKGSSTDIVVAV